MTLHVVCADITTLKIDAIVNAANAALSGGGGVDGAIHRAAGPELAQACRALGGCPTGEVRMTPGFRLPAKWIIHAVGPVWHGGTYEEAKLLESCYRNACDAAWALGARSLAFPGISTGVYHFPKDEAARIAAAILRQYAERFDALLACCHSWEDALRYRSIVAQR